MAACHPTAWFPIDQDGQHVQERAVKPLDQHLGHGTGFHVGDGTCGCPSGEVVRQDQDVPVLRRGLFQRPKNVHANTLQSVIRSNGLH
ncbi:hypothetical protein T07_2131 [Trichinella nelsoni]|uniref:Uncharacterized protein n=1 Tax=Trichinella nelsoni TaxID=6336 RepID=A0A0V0RF37_9BILA|nr:hypothetical protein T07_2131 [Trichinella nelsoni]